MLIAINVIFFLAGGVILGGGLFIRLNPDVNKYAEAVGLNVITNELYTAAYVLIAFGAVTFVVGFLGCCGAIRESKVRILLMLPLNLLNFTSFVECRLSA